MSQAARFVRWDTLVFRRRVTSGSIGIYVTELGMFGNMSRRLANSLAIADSLSLAGVIVPKAVIFHRDIFTHAFHSFAAFPPLFLGQNQRPPRKT